MSGAFSSKKVNRREHRAHREKFKKIFFWVDYP